MSVDVAAYLDSLNIDFKAYGKNVGPNDVNIDCPWCYAEKHMGVHKSSGITNCWVCGKQVNMVSLIQVLERIPYHEARKRYQELGGDFEWDGDGAEELFERPESCQLPEEALSFDDPCEHSLQRDHAYSFIKRRGLTVKTVRKYRMKFCPTGRWAHRIIIPMVEGHRLVNWVGRRYLPDVEGRYKNCPVEWSITRMRETFFGLDEFKASRSKALRLVEGFFDKERIGETAMAVFRSKISRKQRSILTGLRLSQASVIFDPEPGAIGRATAIAEDISAVIPVVRVVQLPEGYDPADLAAEDVFEIEARTAPMIL